MPTRTYDPKDQNFFPLSRTKLELFIECPRCFYLDRRYGINRPPIPSFTLNNAVDHLLKKEFDLHRAKKKAHPLMKAYGIKAVPFRHDELEAWRQNRVGVRFLHIPTNFLVYGAVDDVWVNAKKELIVVDYKATSTQEKVTLEGDYRKAYKRQMEIYQWLLRKIGFDVSRTGYFVYCNGRKDRKAFDAKLEFDVQIIPYQGSDRWVDGKLCEAHACLNSAHIPEAGGSCRYCAYRTAVQSALVRSGKRGGRRASRSTVLAAVAGLLAAVMSVYAIVYGY